MKGQGSFIGNGNLMDSDAQRNGVIFEEQEVSGTNGQNEALNSPMEMDVCRLDRERNLKSLGKSEELSRDVRESLKVLSDRHDDVRSDACQGFSRDPTTGLSIAKPESVAKNVHSGHYEDQGDIFNAAEPIAIVGVGLRLPGGIHSTAAFWDLLVNKRETRCRVPSSRYNIDGFYHTSKKTGSVASQYGHFLAESDNLDALDTSFFTMSKAEAEQLDPQQRMVLEVVWECMENGGQTGWRGDNIGVFLGTFNEDWQDLLGKDIQSTGVHKIVSSGDFVVPNRISYEYDLKGPSFAIKTACSSAMIGIHEACQAIHNGGCSSAIIASTNLIITPTMTVTMSEQGILSPEGRSKTFDAGANGYGRGEAVNAIYIKKLSDAIANNDPIRGIIRGSAVNSDGKTSGITMPSTDAHERLIRQAYTIAQIDDYSQTGFFECHGTGTAVGDPLEAMAVARVFGGEKGIYIGSVKPNVGHSEASSGLTSIIKSVLALENKVIPPNIHFTTPNPKIPFKEANLRVPVDPVSWPKSQYERVSVNSFGIAGSNAHVIVDSAASFGIEMTPRANVQSSPRPKLLVFSASNPESLGRYVEEIQNYAIENPTNSHDLAYTLGVRREHLSNRAFCVTDCKSPFELSATIKNKLSPYVTFVFTGQGAQWAGMGKELMEDLPSFDDDIRAMSNILSQLPDPPSWNLREELLKTGTDSSLNKAELSQPLCTAIQVALVNLLRSLNISPAGVVGHSSGEIAAAYAAGAVTLEEATLIAYYRGQVTKSSSRKGSMAAVGMGRTEVNLYMKRGVVIGCENSDSSVTLSGDSETLKEILEDIKSDEPDIFVRLLKVEMAYHSHHMKDLGGIYETLLEHSISSKCPTIPFFSAVTGKRIPEGTCLGASYWRQNLDSPVLFYSAVQQCLVSQLSQPKDHLFLEIGPHSALAGPLRQIFKEKDSKSNLSYLSTLVRDKDCMESVLRMAGQMYLQSTAVNFKALTPIGKVLTDLPLYQWRRDTVFWSEGRLTQDWRFRKFGHHELLGSRTLECTDIEPSWRNILRLEDVPWLVDHKIIDDIIFPCAGYVSMAGEAMRQIRGTNDYSIRHLTLKSALVLVESKSVEMITTFRPVRLTTGSNCKWYEFTIFSYNKPKWIKHCVGRVRPGKDSDCQKQVITDFPRKMASPYKTLKKVGLNYGPAFQGLENVSALPSKTTAAATLVATIESDTYYPLHPTTIDHCLQVIAIAMSDGVDRRMNRLCVPTGIEYLYVSANKAQPVMKAWAMASATTPDITTGTVVLMVEGEVVLSLIGGDLSPIDAEVFQDANRAGAAELEWAPDIDFVSLSSLIHSVPKPTGSFDTVHKLTLLTALEISSQIPSMRIGTDYLQKFCAFLVDYIAQAKEGKLLHFNHVDVKRLTSLDGEDRRQLIDITRAEIATTSYAAIGELLSRVLHNARGIIEGTTKTIEVLIRDDALTNVYNILGDMVDCGSFFASAGHSNPNLKVLEIGAGTGGTSAIALKNLMSPHWEPMYSNYRQRFENYPNMQYQILDITKDPLEQGFEENSYDLIIANNVLHATPSLFITLTNVRKLLQPRGRLFLQELNPGSVQYIDLIMGGLRDWWLGEADGRVDKPYIDVPTWDIELRKAGFGGVEGVVYDDAPPNVLFNIVARPVQEIDTFRRVTLLCSKNPIASVEGHIENLLTAQGYAVSKCTLHEEPPAYQDIISVLDLETPTLEAISPEDFQHFMCLLPKLGSTGVLWVTRSVQMGCEDPHHGLIVGLARTIRSELSIPFTTLELDDVGDVGCEAIIKVFRKFQTREQTDVRDPEGEYALAKGAINVPRYHWVSLAKELSISSLEKNTVSLRLGIEKLGSISSLKWIAHTSEELESDCVVVKVHSAGLNPQDINTAQGLTKRSSNGFGIEGSGVIQAIGADVQGLEIGNRVIFLGQNVLSTTLTIHAKQCTKIPDNLGFEDAATMAFDFTTVIYGLVTRGRLEKDETVLIHSACDSIGLAAIQICQMIGAKIFATTSNDTKVQYLWETSGIAKQNIFHSGDASFYHDLMRETEGRGVDLVLNCLSGELTSKSWDCVAKYGRMIDVGNRDSSGRNSLEINLFEGNRSFARVDVTQFSPEHQNTLLAEIISFLAKGMIKPAYPVMIFPGTSVVDAFTNLQTGGHIGKTIVNIPQGSIDLPLAPVAPKLQLRSDVSYLLIGGLGAVGKSISTWMVECGARHLIYLARSAGKSREDQSFFVELASQGCNVEVISGSVMNLEDVKHAVTSAPKPLAGVIQMAMVLNDALLSEMTHAEWDETLAPRVQGTWNLHHATLGLPLDFFILMSSISGTIGTRGQGNYAASNTFLDAFAQYRQQQGLTAYVIDVGTTAGIGLIGSSNTVDAILQSQSYWYTTESDIIAGLHLAVLRSSQQPMPLNPPTPFICKNHLTLGLRSSRLLSDPSNRIAWKRDVRMSVARNMDGSAATAVEAGKGGELEILLSSIQADQTVLDSKSTREILTLEIGKHIYTLMLQPPEDVNVLQSLEGLGIDSLVTIEIRTWWRRFLGFEVSALEILNAGTIQGLGDLAITSLQAKFKTEVI